MKALLSFLLVAITWTQAHAQDKLPVFLDMTVAEQDYVGSLFSFELKEAIKGSQSFRLIDDGTKFPYLKVAIVTIKLSEARTGMGIAFVYDDVTMPLGGAFVHSAVRYCGREVVQICARAVLASIDTVLESLKSRDAALHKRLLPTGTSRSQ